MPPQDNTAEPIEAGWPTNNRPAQGNWIETREVTAQRIKSSWATSAISEPGGATNSLDLNTQGLIAPFCDLF